MTESVISVLVNKDILQQIFVSTICITYGMRITILRQLLSFYLDLENKILLLDTRRGACEIALCTAYLALLVALLAFATRSGGCL